METKHDHPFYGKHIHPQSEKDYIENLLKKYRNEPVTEDLKKKIWDELQMEKYHGRITIPFKLAMRRDAKGLFPEYVEVILDTKV